MVQANPTGGSKTQLSIPKQAQDGEEVKVDENEKRYMYGTHEDFLKDMHNRLDGVEMNELEKGLLKKFLGDPEQFSSKIVDTLKKIHEKQQQTYNARKVQKLIPLFDKHDFWFTQPVPRYFE